MNQSAIQPSAVEYLGEAVSSFGSQNFTPEVWEKAKTCLLDSLGLSLIAKGEATTLAICNLVECDTLSRSGVTVWPTGKKAQLSDAVGANAVSVHAHFHDDSDPDAWCHPGSLITPVAVGVAEYRQGSVELALRSLIAGYATLNWLGDHEIVAQALIKRGIRTSPALGIVGAAAAASVALGLGSRQTTNALAIAASLSGGTLAPLRSGSDEWRVQNAHAARGGLLAAQLAEKGVIGASTALDGPKGLLQSLAGIETIPSGWKTPLRADAILKSYAKPWATLGDNMAAVRAAKLLHDDGVDITQIERIEASLWRAFADYPGTQYRGPFNLPVQALASTAFAVAAMLIFGDLEYEVSLCERENPALLSLIDKITISPSDDGTKLDSVIVLHMKDGSQLVREAAQAPRNWLYHDAARSADIFESRLTRDKRSSGVGRSIAAELFGSGENQCAVSSLLENILKANH